ncbi:hypothetical protein DIPPA_35392 [Diplonema papillatum]|nr:hypothetical protein DIPPA_35392 [Diplonema papillatum]
MRSLLLDTAERVARFFAKRRNPGGAVPATAAAPSLLYPFGVEWAEPCRWETAREVAAHVASRLEIRVSMESLHDLANEHKGPALGFALHGLAGGSGAAAAGALGAYVCEKGLYGQQCLLTVRRVQFTFTRDKSTACAVVVPLEGAGCLLDVGVHASYSGLVVGDVMSALDAHFSTTEVLAAARAAGTAAQYAARQPPPPFQLAFYADNVAWAKVTRLFAASARGDFDVVDLLQRECR